MGGLNSLSKSLDKGAECICEIETNLFINKYWANRLENSGKAFNVN